MAQNSVSAQNTAQPIEASLAVGAASVLRENHTGSMTKAAPGLYPHQWSWDAAFNAIGWASLDVATAQAELDALLAGQWSNGMVPHIVFDPSSDGYFPGPEVWACDTVTAAAPDGVATSGICQPPVHAVAASMICAAGEAQPATRQHTRQWLSAVYPKLLAWHRYLVGERRDERTGLLAIVHGWESGTDNSPRWDRPYSQVPIASLDGHVGRDVGHVADATQRPSNRDYGRYIGLLEQARAVGYDARTLRRTGDFVCGDVLFTAIFAVASDLLADLAETLGAAAAAELRDHASDARRAVLAQVDVATGLAADVDLRSGEVLRTETLAGFAPLVAGDVPADLRRRLTELLQGPRWIGHPRMRWPLPPSTSPESASFDPRNYWRGPVWPVMSWLLCWSLARAGEPAAAERIATASLAQLGDFSFAEYYEPFTGEPLGSHRQSWTAAAALDSARWRDRTGRDRDTRGSVTADGGPTGGAPGSPADGAAPLLLEGGHDRSGAPLDILLAGGHVVAAGVTAGSHPWARDAAVLDCAGRTIMPAPAEPHAHLDKALLAGRARNHDGDLLGAIRAMATVAASMTDGEMLARARHATQIALAHGFTAIRSHVDVGTPAPGRPVATLAALREELRERLDLQLVALVHDPVTGPAGRTRRQDLANALADGADVVGGAPWLDSDPRRAVDELTAAAADAGRPIDLHLDETTDVAVLLLERFVERVEQLGLGGRATASHCVSLGQLPVERAYALAGRLAAAGVAVVTLPQTNLLLQGRDLTASRRGLAPLRLLEQAGVTLAAGGDNWRDPFNPLGRIDPLETAGLVVAAGHLPPELAYELVSVRARTAMGLAPAALRPGDDGDLLAIRAADLDDALAAASEDRIVIHAGRVVARTTVVSDPGVS